MTAPMSLADVTAAAIEKVLDDADLCPTCGKPRVADVAERDLVGAFRVDTRDPDGGAMGAHPPG